MHEINLLSCRHATAPWRLITTAAIQLPFVEKVVM
jgi:hypothetical protein